MVLAHASSVRIGEGLPGRRCSCLCRRGRHRRCRCRCYRDWCRWEERWLIRRLTGQHTGPLRHLWHDQRLQLRMCRPWWWMRLLRRVHATTAIDWLHWQRGITGEAIVILDSRLVMCVVSAMLLPASTVVFKGILVVLLVIHLQLAHTGRRAMGLRTWLRASLAAGMRVRWPKAERGVCACSVELLVYRGGVGDLWPAKCMHARDTVLVPGAKLHQRKWTAARG